MMCLLCFVFGSRGIRGSSPFLFLVLETTFSSLPLKDFRYREKIYFWIACLSEAKLLVPQLRRRICEGVNDLCCLEMQVWSQEITPQGHGYWLVEFLQVQGNLVERVE